jgi:Zn-finger nucleic acid-binding protein
MTDRQGIEIDYCPQCRGVWLDRGELDKIIERTAAQTPPAVLRGESGGKRESTRYSSEQRHDDDNYCYERKPRKKRGSLQGKLFDFG